MYTAQPVLSQTYYYNDQSSTDMNSVHDYEISSYQQAHGSFSSASTDLLTYSGRRSAQDCSETLYNTMNTCQLVDYIRSVTPTPTESFPSVPKTIKKVEFVDYVRKNSVDQETIQSTDLPTEGLDETGGPMIVSAESASASEQSLAARHAFNPRQAKPGLLLENKIDYPVPQEWTSLMVRALTTASPKPFHVVDLPETPADSGFQCYETCSAVETEKSSLLATEKRETEICTEERATESQASIEVKKPPIKGHSASYHSIVPPKQVQSTKSTGELVAMPEQSEPYIPPPIPMTPVDRPEPRSLRSPFLDALTTAPLCPFTPFENDVITQFDGLRPREEIKLVEALTTAPAEPVSKLNPDLPDETDAERVARLEQERSAKESAEVRELIKSTVDTQLSKKCSAFAAFRGFRSVDPFKPLPTSPLFRNRSRSASVANSTADNQSQSCCTECPAQNSCQRTTSNESQSDYHHSCNYSHAQSHSTPTKRTPAFPPPVGAPARSYVQSGLQSPKSIPKYQRQWFNLPTQSPIRTPEPLELKENVPLAFVDVPHERSHSVSKPYAVTLSATSSNAVETVSNRTSVETKLTTQQQTAVSTSQSEQKCCSQTSATRTVPITMTFQTIDPSQIARSTTPSLINKPAPAIPFYQQNLVCEYYEPTTGHVFNPCGRTPSPRPDCVKSPAPGPPPNPLKILAPRLRTPDPVATTPALPTPCLSTCSSSQVLQSAVDSARLISSLKQGTQTSSQSFTKLPETVRREQHAGLSIEARTSGCESSQAKKSDVGSSSTFQVGDMQIQRNHRVVEEFEHSQKARTIEIQTSSTGQQQVVSAELPDISYGKGYVAKQARRLSETPIATKNKIVSYHFPHTTSPVTTSGFPIKTPPPYSDNGASLNASIDPFQKQVFPPPLATIIQPNLKQSSNTLDKSPIAPIQRPGPILATGPSTTKPNQNNCPPLGTKPLLSNNNSVVSDLSPASAGAPSKPTSNVSAVTAPKRGQGVLNASVGPGARVPQCGSCSTQIRLYTNRFSVRFLHARWSQCVGSSPYLSILGYIIACECVSVCVCCRFFIS